MSVESKSEDIMKRMTHSLKKDNISSMYFRYWGIWGLGHLGIGAFGAFG